MPQTLLQQTASLPDPETIRRTAREVIQRPDYVLDTATDSDRRMMEWFLEILRWLIKPFKWLFDMMHGMPELLRWVIVIALVLVLLALIAHIVYTFVMVFRGPRPSRKTYDVEAGRRVVDPIHLELDAENAMKNGDYIAAVRLLFGACLLRMEKFEKKKYRPDMTNREHLSRLHSTPFFDPVRQFVQTIDFKWYGGRECGPEDYRDCLNAHAAILQLIKEPVYAVSA